ncbi:MAG TPA: response regulator [Flavitalea sp.]|nr:response regulator [Flavitalea sp.]
MRKILVIDDNTDIRENIAEILTLGNYVVSTAENGKKGVEVALKELPDLIVCDIMMPELDGYGVLHLLKKNVSTQYIPFIFLTAKTERTDFRKGMEMGADDYVTKPFDDLELLKAIEIRLKKSDIVQTQYSKDDKGAIEFMKDLSASGLIALDPANYDSEPLSKKSILYSHGCRPKYLYFVNSGKIKTFRLHENGKEYITNLYNAGDYLGHLALLEDANHDDTAEVLEEAEVVKIDKEDFLKAVYNDLTIAARFISLISKDVKQKEERLLNLAYDSLRKRVAKGLLDIHRKFGGDKAVQPALNISREDIAQYVGTAAESLIRTLSDFKSEKLIEIKDGKINILQLQKLDELLY